jgi:hypothetical protein
MTYYTLKAIKEGIRGAGYGFNHYYLKAIEEQGLIKIPENTLQLHKEDNGNFRKDIVIYTAEEIDNIVQTYIKYSSEMAKLRIRRNIPKE